MENHDELYFEQYIGCRVMTAIPPEEFTSALWPGVSSKMIATNGWAGTIVGVRSQNNEGKVFVLQVRLDREHTQWLYRPHWLKIEGENLYKLKVKRVINHDAS